MRQATGYRRGDPIFLYPHNSSNWQYAAPSYAARQAFLLRYTSLVKGYRLHRFDWIKGPYCPTTDKWIRDAARFIVDDANRLKLPKHMRNNDFVASACRSTWEKLHAIALREIERIGQNKKIISGLPRS